MIAASISREVTKAGLVDILGGTGRQNVHGEHVKKLDIWAHDKTWKLYSDGRFYDMDADPDESTALAEDSLTAPAAAARRELPGDGHGIREHRPAEPALQRLAGALTGGRRRRARSSCE